MGFNALQIFPSLDGLNTDKEASCTSHTESPISVQQAKRLRAQECAYSKQEPASDSDSEAMSATLWTFLLAAAATHPSADRVVPSGFRLGTDAIMTIQLHMRSCIRLVSGMNK